MKFRGMLVLLMIVLAAGCGSKMGVPERLAGEWKQAGKEQVRLKFEPTKEGQKGGVYLTVTPGGTNESWLGPLELKQYGENRWAFTLATVENTVGNTTTRMEPPSVSESPDYVIDQRGRLLVRASTHLVKPGEKIELRLEGNQLVAQGLWVRQETQRWDEQGKPAEQKVARLETRFLREN